MLENSPILAPVYYILGGSKAFDVSAPSHRFYSSSLGSDHRPQLGPNRHRHLDGPQRRQRLVRPGDELRPECHGPLPRRPPHPRQPLHALSGKEERRLRGNLVWERGRHGHLGYLQCAIVPQYPQQVDRLLRHHAGFNWPLRDHHPDLPWLLLPVVKTPMVISF